MHAKPLTILHVDEHVVAVSKPSGLLVHRSLEARDRSFLLQKVAAQVGRRVYPVHRIDRAASGIVVFGSTPEAARWIQAAMTAPEACKEYLVLARGELTRAFSVARPLTDERGIRRCARTTLEPITRFERCTLVRARILTGRRHQIRRHLNHVGHHVIGDTTHGKGHVNRRFRESCGLNRLFLHHTRLVIRHEPGRRELVIEDPLPGELRWVLDRLETANGKAATNARS